jgi:superfamily I DNA/RNA helicase/RecB family exonuclease
MGALTWRWPSIQILSDDSGSITDMTRELVLGRPTPGPVCVPELDPSQRAVVEHGLGADAGPLLVLAGPGTGKTTTLVELVAERIAAGIVQPEQVLMLTFSRKAADEMRGRVAARTGAAVTAVTFHAWCYSLVRAYADPEDFAKPPTLITAPEQEAEMAELLSGQDVSTWPENLRQAVRTRGFAEELVRFMDAAVIAGPQTAPETPRPEWTRALQAIAEYDDVAAARNLLDYATLVARATSLLEDPTTAEEIRARYRLIVVDEYQDTDPGQVALLRLLVHRGHEFVAVGDPDQSIYAFRGASLDGVTGFERDFPGARVLPLRRTRRFGDVIGDAAVSILPNSLPGGLDPEILKSHRVLERDPENPGQVDVLTFASYGAEADHVAQTIRRRHYEDGVAWSDFAVLVRTSADLFRFQRALVDADVPVEVAGDEVPLALEPAVRVLLSALEAAVTLAGGRELTYDQAVSLLSGPLAGLQAPLLRQAARAMRREDPETHSEVLIARALADPEAWTDRRAARLAALLGKAADLVRRRESPENLLWFLWSGTDWPRVLNERWEAGGHDRLAADRDLDALCALFHDAARAEERGQKRDAMGYLIDLKAQILPADQLTGSGLRPAAVRVLTAHRSKGLEWDHVFVAGVQEDVWPNLAFRPSLLRPDQLGGGSFSPREQLDEERRLFYVALTRAHRSVTVTAVDRRGDDEAIPSRFVQALLPKEPDVAVAPARTLSLRHIVARLRALGESAESTPVQRSQAASALAYLAERGVRAADPDRWWGTRDLTQADVPLIEADEPVPLSGSSLTTIAGCSLWWFLSSKARGSRGSTTAQGLGLIVHAIAEHVARSGDEVIPADQLIAFVDSVWHRLDFESAWQSARERDNAHEAVRKFAVWHAQNTRQFVAAELHFEVDFTVSGELVRLRGSMDRVELDADGRVHVVDFKTSKSAVSGRELAEHIQLAAYQRAVAHGAVEGHSVVGGSELVQLRVPAGARLPKLPKVQPLSPLEEPSFLDDVLEEAVDVMRGEHITATPSACSWCEFHAVCPTQTPFTIGGGA